MPAAPAAAIEAAAGGVRVHLRVSPKASRTAVQGIAESAPGRMAVKVAVTAPPENGKANEAVLKLLAKEWRLPKTSLEVVAGGADRSKIIHVAGETAELLPRLTDWAAGLVR
ncbi:DUF167 domain-containing protein [Indioceanicola profundi]|uniref:DUF167 domain-containing protein n=1 Tax=Indioceanicola profundi TaxID=2220096 RepID=UPI000E6A9D45|nr:DUF167 domain-containing protein [Indioceanicola profundi]